MSIDEEVVRNVLANCEKQREEMQKAYETNMLVLEAKINAYRKLLGTVEKVTFSKWLDGFMKDQKLTIGDVSDMIGMSYGTIRNWLGGSLPNRRLAGEIGRKLCDLSGNTTSYEDMMAMLTEER